MYSHTPQNYICPICIALNGEESDRTLIKQDDIIYKDEVVTAFVNSFFLEGNDGHVLIVPNKHYENVFDLPEEINNHVQKIAKKMAILLKEKYKCDGISLLQNNEPAGDQHVFHYHLHVFPRYNNDHFNNNLGAKKVLDPNLRKDYANKLKNK